MQSSLDKPRVSASYLLFRRFADGPLMSSLLIAVLLHATWVVASRLVRGAEFFDSLFRCERGKNKTRVEKSFYFLSFSFFFLLRLLHRTANQITSPSPITMYNCTYTKMTMTSPFSWASWWALRGWRGCESRSTLCLMDVLRADRSMDALWARVPLPFSARR